MNGARLIRIDDPADPRIAAYRDIRERDLVGRQGRFVAEGRVVVRVLLTAGRFQPESMLLLENRVDGAAELIDLAPPEMPIYVASAAVLDAVAGFAMHRGIIAIGKRGEAETSGELIAALPQQALVVAAAGIANHDNMGSIFRNAAAFGADAVLLDPGSCDPLYRKAIRVSVGAALKVPFAVADSLDGLVGDLQNGGFQIIALSPAGAVDIADVRLSDRMALLLGTEGEGLPADVLSRFAAVRIAMAQDFDSLNVAAASAIALHRLWRG
jgi:tRNA G18 (ribose-2'-O)-methylase SpoU